MQGDSLRYKQGLEERVVRFGNGDHGDLPGLTNVCLLRARYSRLTRGDVFDVIQDRS